MNGLLKDMRRARFQFQSMQNPTQPVTHIVLSFFFSRSLSHSHSVSLTIALIKTCIYPVVGLLIKWKTTEFIEIRRSLPLFLSESLSLFPYPNLLIDTLYFRCSNWPKPLTSDNEKCLSWKLQHFLCVHFSSKLNWAFAKTVLQRRPNRWKWN